MESQLKRFMNLSNLDYKIKIENERYNKLWNRVCVHVVVFEKDSLNIEYNQHHCYDIRGRRHDPSSRLHIDDIRYEEGNTLLGAGEGLMAYFGDDDFIHRYFEKLSRQVALDKINEYREN